MQILAEHHQMKPKGLFHDTILNQIKIVILFFITVYMYEQYKKFNKV